MKELTAVSRNIYITTLDTGDGMKLSERVECVLTVSEPVTEIDSAGQVLKRRVTSDLRFLTNAAALRNLAEQMAHWADEADAVLNLVKGRDAAVDAEETTP